MCSVRVIVKFLRHITAILIFLSCSHGVGQTSFSGLTDPGGNTIMTRFSTPEGFSRLPADRKSFAFYLRRLPLKPHGSPVRFFNGTEKRIHYAAAVIDMPVGNKDLMQCADAVMKLRADFLRSRGREKEIIFHFTSGSEASWEKWKEGYRSRVEGNEVQWLKSAPFDDSEEAFGKYLETVFMYSGTLSLERELDHVHDARSIETGDVFIMGGSPGHAVIVVDVASNHRGEKIFLLAQGFMPAQNIHIVLNMVETAISPWYRLSEGQHLFTPVWTFDPGTLKRFP
jgi:hypothetical protein